ncbi:MAG TPA: hypothetical protein VM533_08420 [Fimbriiglobus sp.]|jgi:hypothetical protein|nr:hypothetical protein [Fimbriiglobus sp.]
MSNVFRIYLKNLASTRPVNPNDPLAGALPDSSSYWGEGTMYVIGLGLKEWFDAVCNPAIEPTADLDTIEGDSLHSRLPRARAGDPEVFGNKPSVYSSRRVMQPRRTYPATRYTESDFWWDRPASDVTGDAVLIYFLRTSAESLIVRREPGFSQLGGGGTTRSNGSGTISEVYVESLLRGGTVGNMQTLINVAFHEAMHNKLQAGQNLHNDGGLAADRNWPEDTLNETNIRRMRAALATPVIQDTQYLSLRYV